MSKPRATLFFVSGIKDRYTLKAFNMVETMQTLFEIQNLRLNYGLKTVVEDLSMKLERGQSLGLLGANGAGKTSTLKALLGMMKPKAGSIQLFGETPGKPKGFMKLGFAPEDGVPPEFLTGLEYLHHVGAFRIKNPSDRRGAARELLEYFELAPEKKIKDYSKGMKRRLLLAQAFLGKPELLVLDEPLNGLDPLIIIKLRSRLDAFRSEGGSFLFSSHILAEVEKSCSHVAIMDKGKLLSFKTVESLVGEFGSVEAAFAKLVGGART
jgi:ABC-2 type transport system ATP-binding protein